MIRYQTQGIPYKILTVIVIAFYCLPSHAQSVIDTYAPQPNEYQNIPQPTPRTSATAPDFGPYMADLQRHLRRAWFPPKGYEDRIVVVNFKVHQQGEISNLRLERSSGVPIADMAALKAVENASPVRPLPMGSAENVSIQFTFDYNVFSGGRPLQSQPQNPWQTSAPARQSPTAFNDNQAETVDYVPYMTDLQRKIRHNWFAAKGYENYRTTVAFKIHRDGAISDLRVTEPSGSEIADNAALAAVGRSTPFRPLPFGETKEAVDTTFTFDFNHAAARPSLPEPEQQMVNNNNQNSNVDYGPYMADLQRRVKAHWSSPKGYKPEAKVTVAFRIHRNGAISDLRLERSSGSEIADRAALAAIEEASPFLPLPPGEPKEAVDSSFTFDSNVFTGGRPLPK